jgi:hypothetical protein
MESVIKWRSSGGKLVPGLEPEMMVMADLLDRADTLMTEDLSRLLDNAQLDPLNHVSELFNRLRSCKTSVSERQELTAAATKYFQQLGLQLDVAAMQWTTLMQWRRKRIAFAHPLYANGQGHAVDLDKLDALATAVETQPAYIKVKDTAGVMVKVLKEAVEQQAARQLGL